jgi:hypothetical protein
VCAKQLLIGFESAIESKFIDRPESARIDGSHTPLPAAARKHRRYGSAKRRNHKGDSQKWQCEKNEKNREQMKKNVADHRSPQQDR